jgi:hypothetical protein
MKDQVEMERFQETPLETRKTPAKKDMQERPDREMQHGAVLDIVEKRQSWKNASR